MSEFEKLLESGLLDEETKKSLQEAINVKVKERLEEEKVQLREEFAQRYEHDKKVMVAAADKMFQETLEKEITEFRDERKGLTEARVQYKKNMREHAKAFKKFIMRTLTEEIKELRADRKGLAESLNKFEQFAVKQLTKELTEFHQDKRDLVETKVRLIKEAKGKIDETKKNFIKKAAIVIESKVEEILRKEIGAFRYDIKESRKNNFGRKLFEAFVSEFMVSHLSDGTKLKNMMNAIKERDEKIVESNKVITRAKQVVDGYKTKAQIAESKLARELKMNELLGPLSRDKKEVMSELLESVKTDKLDDAFKKHIRFVLKEGKNEKSTLSENSRREVTGDRKALVESNNRGSEQEDQILKLAGLK